MHDRIFRAYDIRGIVGTELVVDQVYALAKAIAYYYKANNPTFTTVAVGMDGRLHSQAIKNELVRGLLDSGISVTFVGLCTTPVLYFSEYHLPVDGALMITASHNTKEYNGIKITMGKGAIAGDQIQIIKNYYQEKKEIVPSSGSTNTYQEYDLVTVYVNYLASLFPNLVGSAYPLLFDCGNAVAGPIVKKLCEVMQLQDAHIMYGDIDGNYPNHTADPTELHNMQDLLQEVRVRNYSFGIGFDGDADRMGVIMASGKLVPGDVLLSGWARVITQEHPGAAIAYDIKCSDGLREAIEASGGIPVCAPSGHANIKTAMARTNAILAGELSCHFFFKDRYFGFDDGVYAALRLLELVTTYKFPLEKVIELFPHRESSPELRIACDTKSSDVIAQVKQHFEQNQKYTLSEVDGVRVTSAAGWGLIRGSNTQPVICLRFEAVSVYELFEIKNEFIQALEVCFTKKFLEEQVKW